MCEQAVIPPIKVYPRGCGGTPFVHSLKLFSSGLSPRVRGNQSMRREEILEWRSIPAGAGEPGCRLAVSRWSPVYPRGCGGTLRPGLGTGLAAGLSPRVRGNPA